MSKVRNELYAKGYALNYTGGVSRKATVYSTKDTKTYTVDMSDPVKGWEKLQELANTL